MSRLTARARVVVTDGEQRAALATVRSLGAAGYEVFVCSSRPLSIAGSSKYCAGSHRVADALSDPSTFFDNVLDVARTRKADLLLPVSEAALLAILPRRDEFSCAIPFPSFQDFRNLCDKQVVLERAAERGIAVPTQLVLSNPLDAAGVRHQLRFPAVLKPSRSVAGSEGDRIRAGVLYAPTVAAFDAAVARMPENAYPILVQQRIVGRGFGISVLLWDGSLVAAFAHRRLREKPPTGGVSVLRESIPLDSQLLQQSLGLLSDFHWRGVAMVEYKLDEASGIPYLMEINGRLWGSLQLAIDAGVDFPRLLAEIALGGHPAPRTNYKTGLRSRWEWGDVDNLIATVFHPSRITDSFPDARAPGRIKPFVDFLRAFAPINQGEVFRFDDPRPFLRETADWFRRR